MVVQPRARGHRQRLVFQGLCRAPTLLVRSPVVTRRALSAACPLAFVIALAPIHPAGAASKITIAALGDAAPGGGVFAGPPFVSEPSAAGSGWIAFRGLVSGSTTEQIVAQNQLTREKNLVASVGQTVDAKIGSFSQFLGRPTVNARGDVAFVAEIKPPDAAPKPDPTKPLPPTPAGVFLWSQGNLSVVAAPGLNFGAGLGILDLTTPLNLATQESGIDIAERTPALNDAGDVAFVAATLDGTTQRGAIFLRRAAQSLTPVLTLGSPYERGTFQVLGPPAMNNAGTLAFHGLVDGATSLDGVFKLEGGTLSLLIRDGDLPDQLPASFTIDPVFEFGDFVALNDAGDVVCTGGPLFDNSENASLAGDGSPGAILIRPGARPLVVGFPGQEVELFTARQGRIFQLTLGPEEGARTASPALTPDGKVIFFATVNGGSSQAIFRVDPVTQSVFPLVRLGGNTADPAPDGSYLSASSSPAVDAAGNLVFTARLQGGTTSQALVWQPAAGVAEAIEIGDAVPDPGRGYFAGPALFPPLLNDAGDVVFKSHMAAGPSALGIFRFRDGSLTPVVRVRDPAPLDDAPPFTNLVGDPSLNSKGDVAFAATVAARGRGIFVTSGETVRAVAMPFDELPDPQRERAFIRTIASNPSLSDSGAVVFRGTVQFPNLLGPFVSDERQNCVFLADDSGVRIIAAPGDDSGAGGLPFMSFRDPVIRGQSVLFRASIGNSLQEGLFRRDDDQRVRPIVVQGQDLGGGMIVNTVQGKGLLDDAGDVFFNVRVDLPNDRSGAVLMESTAAGLEPMVQTATPGPEGGRIRSLGRLSVSSDGDVALRLGFEPFTGGVPGVFVVRPGGPQTYLRVGEGAAAGMNGRITSLNQNVSLNRDDRVAFLAGVSDSKVRSGIFLAAPNRLRVERLAFRRGPGFLSANASSQPRDRVRFSAMLEPGDLPTPPARDAGEPPRARRKLVTVAVADSVGPLWSGVVSSGDTLLRGRTLRKKRSADTRIGALRVQFKGNGAIRIAARSLPFDLSFNALGTLGRRSDETGAAILVPPFFVRVDVGEDGGSARVECGTPPPARRFRCS